MTSAAVATAALVIHDTDDASSVSCGTGEWLLCGETVILSLKSFFFYQRDAQILYFNTFSIFLYMFRALLCSSSGGQILVVRHLVSSLSLGDCSVHRLRDSSRNLCTDFCNLCIEQSPKESDDTRCSTNTI